MIRTHTHVRSWNLALVTLTAATFASGCCAHQAARSAPAGPPAATPAPTATPAAASHAPAAPAAPAKRDNTINFVEIYTVEMKATQAFYAAVFGWRFKDYGPSYADIQGAGMAGGFAVVPKAAPRGGPLVVIYSADLERCQRRITAHGGTVTKPAFSFPGGRRFHFADPGGNELAVWSER